MSTLSKFKDISIKKSDQQMIKGGKEPKPPKLTPEEKECLKAIDNGGNGNGVW